jgi:hypothetical protein
MHASEAERLGQVTRRQLVDPAVHSCEGCFGEFGKLGMAVFVAHQHAKCHRPSSTRLGITLTGSDLSLMPRRIVCSSGCKTILNICDAPG